MHILANRFIHFKIEDGYFSKWLLCYNFAASPEVGFGEVAQSGLTRALGKRVYRKVSWVRIPPSPPEDPYWGLFLFERYNLFLWREILDLGYCLPRMDKLLRVKVHSLVYEGYGLGRSPDGKAVFVPFVIPGETVDVRILEEKKGHVLAEPINIVEPDPNRILPTCKHFGKCGGCHYQHIPYELQLRNKKSIYIEQLQRIAGVNSPESVETFPSPYKWAYRNTMQFSLSDKGKLSFSDFYRNTPFEIGECYLPMPDINSFWPQVDFDPETYINRVEIRQNQDGEIMLIVRGSDEDLPEMTAEAAVSIVHIGRTDHVVLAGDDFLVMRIKEKEFKVSAGSFFQTNLEGANRLVDIVLESVSQNNCQSVMDVYCGVGLFSAFLADRVDQIIGIESSSVACNDYAVNLDKHENVSLYEGKAENILATIEEIPDCIIVDPPRSGLKRETALSIIRKAPRLLIYVSCNPSTLARDVKFLIEAGYKMDSSKLVDMFPQTFHIETVVLMSRVKE